MDISRSTGHVRDLHGPDERDFEILGYWNIVIL